MAKLIRNPEQKKIFRPGDKVLITKPTDEREGPSWTIRMDEHDGQVRTIENIRSKEHGYYSLVEATWTFDSRWLTLIEEEFPDELPEDGE